jgi:hypothetical protein
MWSENTDAKVTVVAETFVKTAPIAAAQTMKRLMQLQSI